MKKIFLFSLVACMGIVDAGFAGNCQIRDLTSSEQYDSDEYLYVSAGHYRNRQVFACERRGNSKNCNNGTKVAIRGEHYIGNWNYGATGGTAFEILECSARGLLSNDKWVNVGTSSLKKCDATGVGLESSYVLFGKLDASNNVYCLKTKYTSQGTSAWCTAVGDQDLCVSADCPECNDNKVDPNPRTVPMCKRFDGNNSRVEVNFTIMDSDMCPDELKKTGANKCRCTCVDEKNPHWQCDVNTCVKPKQLDRTQRNISGGLGVCKDGNNPGPVQSCKESRSSAEGKACCDLSSKIAKWDGKNCLCQDINKEFKIQKGKGVCVAKQQKSCKDLYKGNTEAIACCEAGENWIDGKCECNEENKVWDSKLKKCVANATPVTTCTPSDCYLSINQTVRCNNGNYWKSNERINICKEQLTTLNTCSDLQSKITSCQDVNCINNIIGRIDAYDELIKRVCGGSGVVPTPVPDNGAEILAAENTLTSFFRNAESNASVWKDKDGNFNTARLASDLTAGVILGTVGGVVSGVVIKKKQVEKGFDALHCTVGGQTVADWGDIFNVGLRR